MTKPNLFDPVLSSNAYIGRIQENERTVQLQPRLYASDADPSNTPNGFFYHPNKHLIFLFFR